MRTIERAAAFKRDYKRELKGRYRKILVDRLADILHLLAKDKALDSCYCDHSLNGNWAGYRECHIKPDLLLIYRKKDPNILRLARLGSHSELFS